MTEVEQVCSLNDHLPSVEDYLQRRMGSSAVGVCLALTEYTLTGFLWLLLLTIYRYAFDMELPTLVMQDIDMRQLWDETNIIIST